MPFLDIPVNADADTIFKIVEQSLEKQGFVVEKQDLSRPWGGFFVLDESQAPKFIETYFPHLSMTDFGRFNKLSPKILVVAPHKRLSWQYHFRRAEIWRTIGGTAGLYISDTDEQKEFKNLPIGEVINLTKGQRHRLVGLENWGVVAEIWEHTDPEHPSDEDDIVRLQDDFGR
jgi:mannose-6-phosphate isomerase